MSTQDSVTAYAIDQISICLDEVTFFAWDLAEFANSKDISLLELDRSAVLEEAAAKFKSLLAGYLDAAVSEQG